MTHRLLVAEDNFVMANVLRFTLERAGYHVTVAALGSEAAEHAAREAFDLVLTDYQMPGLSGEQLCRRLREDTRYANIPIILCTAKGFELQGEELRAQLQLSALISKPFSPQAIVKLVGKLLALETIA